MDQLTNLKNVGHGSAGDKRKHLVFSLDGKRYAIPLSLIKEVIGNSTITPVPMVPTFYKGMINLRGQVISVIDLRLKLGMKEVPFEVKKSAILIVYAGDITLGCIVDEIIEVVTYDQEQVEPISKEQKPGEGVYAVAKDAQGTLTLLISIEKSLERSEFQLFKNKVA